MSQSLETDVPISESSSPTFAEGDSNTFINRYPYPHEVLRNGGKEGVQYCFVSGSRIGYFSRMAPDENGDKWSYIKRERDSEEIPTMTIVGPNGSDDSVILMAKGKPTYGAADHNGVRRFLVDVVLEEKTGIPANPNSPVATKLSNLPLDKVAEKPKDKGNASA